MFLRRRLIIRGAWAGTSIHQGSTGSGPKRGWSKKMTSKSKHFQGTPLYLFLYQVTSICLRGDVVFQLPCGLTDTRMDKSKSNIHRFARHRMIKSPITQNWIICTNNKLTPHTLCRLMRFERIIGVATSWNVVPPKSRVLRPEELRAGWGSWGGAYCPSHQLGMWGVL